MTTLNDLFYTDGLHDVLAAYVNNILGATLRAEYRNVQTITATKTLTDADTPIQRLTPSGANRDVTLPSLAATNHPFFIINGSGTYSLTMPAGYGNIPPGKSALYISDGVAWCVSGADSSGDEGGWTRAGAIWAYSAADSPSFTISMPDADAAKVGLGWRILLTQTTAKYFIVTKKGSPSGGYTPVTVYGGTDYTLTNAAISGAHFSPAKAPAGFPLDPRNWSITVASEITYTKSTPAASIWYNAMDAGSLPSISLPVGLWRVSYTGLLRTSVSAGYTQGKLSLSSFSSSESDRDLTTVYNVQDNALSVAFTANLLMMPFNKILSTLAKTTYYLIVSSNASSVTTFQLQGAVSTTIIRAECAYL